MKPIRINFGEWLPDLPDFENPGLTVASNVIPYGENYLPFPSLTQYTSDTISNALAITYGKDASGNTYNFFGTTTALYRLVSAAFSDVSKVGGYSTAADGSWYFSTYGQRMLATNFNDAIQNFTMGTSSAFADLAASAPRARYITAMRDFVVVGNTFDSVDGNVPHRVRWCGIGDPTSWTVSPTTQADYQNLDSSKGWVQQVVGGEYGVIFQERAITRMTYVGSPLVFQFDEVESNRGAFVGSSVIKIGNYIAYLGFDGFYIFDGQRSISIGENKVNRAFFNDLDFNYKHKIRVAADIDKQIIYWAYPGPSNSSGVCNRILSYNYAPGTANSKRWTLNNDVDVQAIGITLSEGYTLDSLDTLSTDLDSLEFSLDSRIYTGDDYVLSGISLAGFLSHFTGDGGQARLETAEFELTPGNRTYLKLIRPIVDGLSYEPTITLQIGTRDNLLTGSVTWGSIIDVNSNNEFEVRSNSRYHRLRLRIVGNFKNVIGIEIHGATLAGRR